MSVNVDIYPARRSVSLVDKALVWIIERLHTRKTMPMLDNSRLIRIKELTQNPLAVPFSKTIRKLDNTTSEFSLSIGSGELVGLYSDVNSSVALAKLQAGTLFPWHSHKECEVLTVTVGVMLVEIIDRSIVTVHPGDSIAIPTNIPHRAEFPEYTEVIAITVPSTEDFPNANGD